MKLASEAALLSFSHKNKNILNIFRFPNVVGVPATHGVIFDFINKIKKNGNLDVLGNGTQKKSYLHVSELINAMEYVNENNNEDSLIINLGNNDDGITVKEIAEMVASKFENNIKISYGKNSFGWVGDIPKFKFDTDKLNNMGWSPKLSSKEAVKLAIDEIYNQLIT
jgi:UDP-glucose 4-epimerase